MEEMLTTCAVRRAEEANHRRGKTWPPSQAHDRCRNFRELHGAEGNLDSESRIGDWYLWILQGGAATIEPKLLMPPKPGLFDRALLPIYEAIVDNPQATTQHMALSTLVGPEAAVAGNAAEDNTVHDVRFFHPSVRDLTLAEVKLPAKRAFNLSAAAAGNFKVNLSQRRPPKFAFTDLIGWQKPFVCLLQNPAERRARHLR